MKELTLFILFTLAVYAGICIHFKEAGPPILLLGIPMTGGAMVLMLFFVLLPLACFISPNKWSK